MKNSNSLLLSFFLFLSVNLSAQIPEYYQSVNFSLEGSELMEELRWLVSSTHTTDLSYTPGVWDALKQTDLDPDNNEVVLLIYGFDDDDGDFITDRRRGVDENCQQSDCSGLWNREHVVARSQANPSLPLSGPGTDVHNLRACDARMNERRGNRRFADGFGNSHITSNGDFYPGDEWRGDVARMLMYMYLRYDQQCLPEFASSGTQNFDPDGIMIDILLVWNAEDPVSEYEIIRNDILEDLQGNRNPFIDNPYLATKIWNGPKADDLWNISSTVEEETAFINIYPTISQGVIYADFSVEEEVLFSIYHLSGKKVKSGKLSSEINLPDSNGWHFIELIHSTGRQIEKVFLTR